MIFNNNTRFFFLSLLLSFFLITTMSIGMSCTGSQNNNNVGTQTTPTTPPPATPDPLALAQASFKDKVSPFFNDVRCVNCHGFVDRAGTAFTHPPLYDPITAPLGVKPTKGNTALAVNCAGCHGPGIVGFPVLGKMPPSPLALPWIDPPENNTFKKDEDSNKIRTQILAIKGADIHRHLLGTGENADPLVQWAFFNAPDELGNPGPPPGFIKVGVLPNRTIPDAELLDFEAFKKAVEEWICLEAKVPGNPAFNLPATLVCP